MPKLLVIVLATLIAFSLSPLVVAQGDLRVYLRGGNAEKFVNDCAAVERIDTQGNTLPVKDAQALSFCFGYNAALIDTWNTDESARPGSQAICVPDNASATQLAKVVVKYGHEHPEELNKPAFFVVTYAFKRSFPCK